MHMHMMTFDNFGHKFDAELYLNETTEPIAMDLCLGSLKLTFSTVCAIPQHQLDMMLKEIKWRTYESCEL